MKKNIYIPKSNKEIWNRFEQLADQKNRSIDWMVNQAVKMYLQNEKEKAKVTK